MHTHLLLLLGLEFLGLFGGEFVFEAVGVEGQVALAHQVPPECRLELRVRNLRVNTTPQPHQP